MRLNPNKRIGKVLYLVEGDVDEVVLLEHIFNHIFNYKTVSYDKRNQMVRYLVAPNDEYSKIYIVPMEYPSISKIQDSGSYINEVYEKLKQYGLERDECAKYLIFDRDRDSNTEEKFRELFSIFKNSLDNDLEINGLLLVSYPCLQSFYCECNGDDTEVSSSKKMKKHSKKYRLENIDGESILCACSHLLSFVNTLLEKKQFDVNNLDNMEPVNVSILNKEEENYRLKRTYFPLSTILFSLIDLGLIDL